jgi:hypothetical protein
MKRIRWLLVCAFLSGCGCVAPDPESPSTCYGIGTIFKDDTPEGAER